jgi:hypothetical protein
MKLLDVPPRPAVLRPDVPTAVRWRRRLWVAVSVLFAVVAGAVTVSADGQERAAPGTTVGGLDVGGQDRRRRGRRWPEPRRSGSRR